MDIVRTALWKGCLGGLGLVIVFFVISGLTYLALSFAGIGNNMTLLLSIISGPVLGTGGLLGILYVRARRAQRTSVNIDETTSTDAP